MAHMVETMAYRGATPWHGLGTRVVEEMTVESGMVAAGLNWSVEKQPLFLADGRSAPDVFAMVRSSDQSILGTVGTKYTPLQNVEAFKWFDPFLESKQATLHTAGSLQAGKRVWVLAHVNGTKSEVVPGDRVDSFILLSHGHDGSMCVRVGFTPIRVVCANTLAAAHGDKASGQLLRVRHTKSLHSTLDKVREVMDVARSEFAATMEQYRFLASREVNEKDLRRYVRIVLGATEKAEKESGRTHNTIEDMVRRAISGVGNAAPGVRNTLWGAYNGVTESFSHRKTSNAETRLNSLWFGANSERSEYALGVALAIANGKDLSDYEAALSNAS